MMKKIVHIISHNHLDREWYMPYAQHHMRLVELFNDLNYLFDNDPNFKSFHLDGQTIPLDDYLEVYPHMKDKVHSWIRDGKLKIGPFYILQDAFLTSSESNARNTLVGLNESKKWGNPVKLGYFPDTFGNVGQTPQMMKQAGLDTVAFGRGVKATGFNNVVIEEDTYTSQYSEMMWSGADKSEVLSILFANWYSNGNEIPTTKEAAMLFWDRKLSDVEKYASTRHLLMMNGCDHQPVQKDITEAIRLANELYPEYEFIHSNFDDYISALKSELPDNLATIEGELTSQESNGWYTLANTASSRVYLKQKNVEVSNMLEQIAEPLAVFADFVGTSYPNEMLHHAWKVLMQNHPHDSICGCGVDAIHRGMMTRFETALEVGKFVKDASLEAFGKAIDTSMFKEGDYPFYIVNTQGNTKSGCVEIEIELDRHILNHTSHKEAYDRMKRDNTAHYCVVDSQGKSVDFEVVKRDTRFNYKLPKDAFRIAYIGNFITVRLAVDKMAPYSWQTFALRKTDSLPIALESSDDQFIENDALKIEVISGRINITDKINNVLYADVVHFEECGDIGNEYIFKKSHDNKTIDARKFFKSSNVIEHTNLKKVIEITYSVQVPVSAADTLQYEYESITDITQRTSLRSKKYVPFEIKTRIILEKYQRFAKFETTIDNQVKDHRVRVVFSPNIKTHEHHAESVFEVVKRPNRMGSSWENPENPQHQHAFVSLADNSHVMVVGNIGLHEYEVLENSNLAITLFRGVGELGDWGYFDTPEAQCLGVNTYEYSVGFGLVEERFNLYQQARANQVSLESCQIQIHTGNVDPKDAFIDIQEKSMIITSLKRGENSDDYFVRGYNMNDSDLGMLVVNKLGHAVYNSDLIESVVPNLSTAEVKPCEIKTLRIGRL